MAPMQNRNLAARAGYWSARHRKTAILGWLAFVVVAVFAGAQIGTEHIPQGQSGTGESGHADRVLDKQFKARAGEQVLVQSRTATVSEQLGVGRSTAIFVDATIVRAVLLPATMKLLGDRNWYLPQRLRLSLIHI